MSAIRVELELRDGSFVSGMLRAGQSLDSFRKELARLDPHFKRLQGTADGAAVSINRIDQNSRTMLGTFRDISVVAGATMLVFQALSGSSNGLISNIIKVNAEMEKLKFQMMGMSQAADPVAEAAHNVEYLRDVAAQAPFSIRELTSTFVKLKAAGIDDTNKSMQALVDGIAAFGGSDEQLHRVTLGIAQMAGKGVIQMEEMRQQLGESMPTAMRLMARSMGVSVSELIDAIATGRVEARSALAGFTEELDRAYGGTAQRMMQTFSGQLTQLYANLQRLATEEGGQLNLFFERIKEHLREFNTFLASPAAKQMANEFGKTLNTITEGIVMVVNAAYQFREEIKLLAVALASGLTFSAITSALSSLQTRFVVAGAQASLFFNQMRNGGAVMGLAAVNALTTTGQAAISTGMALSGARLAAIGFGSAVMTFAPYLAIAAAGIGLLASKYDLLGNSTREAYQNLLDYGAETARQARETIAPMRAELQTMLELKQARLDAMEESGASKSNPKTYQRLQAERDRILAGLKKLDEQEQEFASQGLMREIEKERSKIQARLDLASEAARKEYQANQVALEDKYQQDLDAALKAEDTKQADIAQIEKEYQTKSAENRQKLLRRQIQDADQLITELNNNLQGAIAANDQDAQKKLEGFVEMVRTTRLQLSTELSALIAGGAGFGVPLLGTNPNDSEALQKKGEEELGRLREEISGLEADIAGASGEYAKLMFRIRRGDYGSIEVGGQAVKNLIEDLKEATQQKEALDKIMSGRASLTSDLEAIEQNLREGQLELAARRSGQELNEAEKVIARINAGYYEGLGPIENIRKSVMNLTSVTNTQGLVAQEAARVMFDQTFGDRMLAQVNRLRDAIFGVTDALKGMTGAAGGFTVGGAGSPNIRSNVDGGILDLIASKESRGDYNATLDNGMWTNGPRNLTQMTVAEIRELQRYMLSHEANRRKYGNGKGSSALGRYQIVGSTLESLIEEMGLSGNELFDEAMQDAMAKRLIARRGGDPAGMRLEWAGLAGVSDADIRAAISRSTMGAGNATATSAGVSPVTTSALPLPGLGPGMNTGIYNGMVADQVAYTEEAIKKAEELDRALEELQAGNADMNLSDGIKELKEKILDTNKPIEELGKNYQNVVDTIRSGKLGDTNVGAERYKEILALAKELDAAEKARDARSAAEKESQEQFKRLEQERADLQRQIADAQERAKNPDYEGTSEDLAQLNAQFDEYLKNIEIANGKNSQAYKDALAYKEAYLSDANALRAATIVADMAAERQTITDSLLTERDLRRVQLERELAMVDQRAEQLRAAGMAEVEITRLVEEQKAAIRARYNQESLSPINQQMKEWSDLQGNLEQASARWMDSAASGLAGLITGTGDLRSALTGMINDVANMAVRYFFSQLMPAGGKTGGAGKKSAVMRKAGTAGKMPMPVKHTGGVAGVGGGTSRMTSIAAFAGAKRFHVGGIVGGASSLNLRRDEVPVITKKGEGIFTPEQMQALGGFSGSQAFTINAPVSVNGSAGTPDQNADLAKKISESMENTMRMVVIDEMRRQIRPGNMMNTGAR